ncbi:hypothetical protein ACLMJV_13610 [Sinorhizobium meliloti]
MLILVPGARTGSGGPHRSAGRQSARDRPLFNASMDRRLRDAAAYPKL